MSACVTRAARPAPNGTMPARARTFFKVRTSLKAMAAAACGRVRSGIMGGSG